MGVGASHHYEEQLEAALSLLDAARSKQELLRAECDNLQARLTAQASQRLTEQNSSIHLVREGAPLSKRVLFGLAVTIPLATHQFLSALSIQIVDTTALVQAVVLSLAVALLLCLRRYRWRRIRPERIVSVNGSPNQESAEGRLIRRPSIEGNSQSNVQLKNPSALMASESELACLAEVKAALRSNPPSIDRGGGLVPTHEPLLDVQLIRFLREHGPNAGKIEKCYRNALEWRKKNLPEIPGKMFPLTEEEGAWMSSAEMPHGQWATKYAPIGLHCGVSKIGCPVKLERIGKYNLPEMQASDPNYRKKLNQFYLGLIEFLQQRLDWMSLQEGRLVQTYEIFDLQGLSMRLVSFTVLQFTKDILLNFATHYPSSFRKAVIINAPSFINWLWSSVSGVLPKSVKAKVKILGPDFYNELQEDLGEDALAWCVASNEDLARAPHPIRPPTGAARSNGNDEPLDGEPVVVEDD